MTERLYFYFILMRFLLYPLSEWKEKPLEEINGKQTNTRLKRNSGARGSLERVQGRKRIRRLGVM